MKCFWNLLFLVVLFTLFAGSKQIAAAPKTPAAKQSLRIEKLLSFAGDNAVRIETTLTSDNSATGPLELHGKITRWPQGATLWEGSVGRAELTAGKAATVAHMVQALKPQLWDLQTPQLYNLTVSISRPSAQPVSKSVRFGFRSFTSKNGQFLLNGRKLYLRGNAINPPGRGTAAAVKDDPTFARAYISDLKRRNINLIRLGVDDADVWMDACDELGMLIFQGRYGAPRGGTRFTPPADFDASIEAYKKEYFERHLSHPAVVINILTNEMPISSAYTSYLTQAYRVLRTWDPNRLYIDNAGFGHGRTGDINDQHPYAGWYNRDFLAFYRQRAVPEKVQPITFTETVAAYTGADGRFNTDGKQLAASLTWTGHSSNPIEDSLAYQAFLTKQIIEINRRLRSQNPQLAGVMPFTNIFYHLKDVNHFEQMGAKPVADQMRISYQPLLLSWEVWTPQVYSGTRIRAIAHIVNDSDGGNDLKNATLSYELQGQDGVVRLRGNAKLPDVAYYEAKSQAVSLALPAHLPSGDYRLRGNIVRSGKIISTNSVDLYVAVPDSPRSGSNQTTNLALYDPNGKTTAALQRLGVVAKKVTELGALRAGNSLVIGEDGWDNYLSQQQSALKHFVQSGGRIVLLRQDANALAKNTGWFGANLRFASTSNGSSGVHINPERPEHPIFEGVTRERLRFWSDTTGWDETKLGVPAIMPVRMGFRVARQEDLAHTAVLADFGRGLVDFALAEIFEGRGSVLICGFDLVARSALDPIADRLFRNIVNYTTSPSGHDACPLIEKPILWGDYATERGVVGSPLYGLLVNIEEKAVPNPSAAGLFSKQSVASGRRAFGPFSYNGNCHIVDEKPESPTGSGVFFARIAEGNQWIVTTVRNPSAKAASMAVELNGRSGEAKTLQPGKEALIQTPIPDNTTEVAVRYSGGKELVLLKTEFTKVKSIVAESTELKGTTTKQPPLEYRLCPQPKLDSARSTIQLDIRGSADSAR